MQFITLTEAVPSEGYKEGQTIAVDELSADALIKAGRATAYEAPEADVDAEPVTTIDDIVDPGVAEKRSQMATVVVGGVDPAPLVVAAADDTAEPPTVEVDPKAKAKSTTASSASAAPGPNPAGAVADGNPNS